MTSRTKPNSPPKLAILALAAGIFLSPALPVAAQSSAPPAGPAASSSDEASLKAEIQRLREENQALRRLLALQGKSPGGEQAGQSNPPEPKPVKSGSATQSSAKYWLSPSGKRHNQNCRYFGSGSGKPAKATDGSPCKLCGG